MEHERSSFEGNDAAEDSGDSWSLITEEGDITFPSSDSEVEGEMVSNQVPSTNLVEMDSLDLLNALVIDNHPPQQHFEIFETRVVDLDSIIGYNRPDSPTLEEHTFTFLKPPGQRVSFAEVECRARFFDPDPTVAGEPHYSLDTTYLSGVKENEEDYLDDLGDLVEDESEYGAMDAKMTMEQDQELAQDESVIPCTQQHHVLLPAASWSWTATAPTFLPPKSSFFIDMAATTTADESKIVDGVATQEIMTENTIMPNKIQQNGIILTENDSELLPLCMKKDQEEGQLLVTVTDKEKRIMVVEHSVVNSDTRVEIEAKNTSSSSSTSGCEDTVITMSGRETALQSSAEEGSSSASPTTTYPSWDGCSSSSTEAETEDDEVSSDCGLHDFVFPEVFVSPYTSSSLPINEELETDRDETPAAVEKLIRKDERKEFKFAGPIKILSERDVSTWILLVMGLLLICTSTLFLFLHILFEPSIVASPSPQPQQSIYFQSPQQHVPQQIPTERLLQSRRSSAADGARDSHWSPKDTRNLGRQHSDGAVVRAQWFLEHQQLLLDSSIHFHEPSMTPSKKKKSRLSRFKPPLPVDDHLFPIVRLNNQMPPLANDPIEEATAEGGGEKGKMHFEDHGISRCGGRQPENHDDNKHQQKSNEMKENNLHMAMINTHLEKSDHLVLVPPPSPYHLYSANVASLLKGKKHLSDELYRCQRELVSSHGRERACHRRLSEFRCRIINDDAQPQVMTTEETLAVSGLLSRQPSTIFEESLLIPLLLTGDKSSSSSMVDIKMDASEIPEEQIPTSSSIIANGTVSAERVRRILALLGGHQNDDQDRWWWRELLHDVAFQFPLAATIREDSYSMDAGDQPIEAHVHQKKGTDKERVNDSADREEGHPPDEHLAGEQIPLPPPFIVDEVNDKCVSKKNLPPIPSFSKPLSGIPYHRDGDDNHGYNGCLCGLNGCLGGPNHHDETPSVPPVPKAEDEGSWLLRRAILRDQLRGEQVGEEDGDEGDKASSGNHTSKDDKHPAGHLDGHQQQATVDCHHPDGSTTFPCWWFSRAKAREKFRRRETRAAVQNVSIGDWLHRRELVRSRARRRHHSADGEQETAKIVTKKTMKGKEETEWKSENRARLHQPPPREDNIFNNNEREWKPPRYHQGDQDGIWWKQREDQQDSIGENNAGSNGGGEMGGSWADQLDELLCSFIDCDGEEDKQREEEDWWW